LGKNGTVAFKQDGILSETTTSRGFKIIIMEDGLLFIAVIALIADKDQSLHDDGSSGDSMAWF
jgi:hypothetical protein